MNLARNIVDNNIVAASGLIPRRNIFNQKSKRGEWKSAKKKKTYAKKRTFHSFLFTTITFRGLHFIDKNRTSLPQHFLKNLSCIESG